MIVPLGPLIRLIEQLFTRAQDNSDATQQMFRVQHVANAKGAAFRAGGTYEEHGLRTSVRVGGVLVELAYDVHNRAFGKMVWMVSSRFPVFKIEPKQGRRGGTHAPIPWFGDRFFVVGKDTAGIAALWTEQRCQAAYRTAPLFSCTSDGSLLQLTAPYPRDAVGIDNGIALMRSLAQADVYGTAVLKDLPNAVFVDAQLPYALLGNTDIRIGYARVNDQLVTEACVPVRGLSSDAEARLRALGATMFATGTADTTMRWATAITERARVLELAETLRTLVQPTGGVFR